MSLATGAVRGRDSQQLALHGIVNSLARHYDFDVGAAWDDLPQKIRLCARGQQRRPGRVPALQANGRLSKKRQPWEGFMPYMERRYRETSRRACRGVANTWAHRLSELPEAPG